MKKILPLPLLVIFFAGCGSPPSPPARPAVRTPKVVELSPPTTTYAPQPPRMENHFNAPDGYRFHDSRDFQVRPYVDAFPTGAIAKCRDGSYSFSRSRSGACSNHGGVDIWYDDRSEDPKSPPPGAIAECRDGTYSYARTQKNVCADHGGVAVWFR